MTKPRDILPHGWVTCGSSDLWDPEGTNGTYARIEIDRLPTLPPSKKPFDWLIQLPKHQYDDTLDNSENALEGWPQIRERAKALGHELPPELGELVTRREIQAQIPTCTSCYLALSEDIIPLPGFPGCHALRFLNDQQACILWYLLLQRDESPLVLATPQFIEPDIFADMAYTTVNDKPLPYSEVLNKSMLCADSFSEFIFRFCVENRIWFARHYKTALSGIEQRYLQAALHKE